MNPEKHSTFKGLPGIEPRDLSGRVFFVLVSGPETVLVYDTIRNKSIGVSREVWEESVEEWHPPEVGSRHRASPDIEPGWLNGRVIEVIRTSKTSVRVKAKRAGTQQEADVDANFWYVSPA